LDDVSCDFLFSGKSMEECLRSLVRHEHIHRGNPPYKQLSHQHVIGE
jgi:hypothetical protein